MPKIGIMENMHNIVESMENEMEWIENTEHVTAGHLGKPRGFL